MTLDKLALQALGYWGVTDCAPQLIAQRENAVFRVTLADGRPAALRLHRPGYNSVAEIRSELWWTQAMAARGFRVPEPIARPDGGLLAEVDEGQTATMISWIEGAPIGYSGELLSGTFAEQEQLYQQIGGLLAEMHTISDTLKPPPDFTRRNWNRDGLLGDSPLWGRFWEHPVLTAQDRSVILAAREKARGDLAAYDAIGAAKGLIHADALRENVFSTAGGLVLIDFDDSGYGYRMFDLAVAVSQSLEDENYASLRDAVLAGYAALRPLSEADTGRMELFALLRTFASLGWIVPRLAADEPSHKKFIRRAVLQSQGYLDQGSLTDR